MRMERKGAAYGNAILMADFRQAVFHLPKDLSSGQATNNLAEA